MKPITNLACLAARLTHFFSVLGLYFFLAMQTLTASAETQYVSDSVMVPIRSGAGNEFRIINSRIPTGTALEILSNPPGDWAEVKTANGTQGWIRKQYLQATPIAKTLLDKARTQQTSAEQKLAGTIKELQTLQQQHNELLNINDTTQKSHSDLSIKYQNLRILSEDAVNLSQRYQALLADHEVLLTQHDALKAENDNLRNDQTISHGLYAVALLLSGVVLTIILPLFRPRRRYSDQIL